MDRFEYFALAKPMLDLNEMSKVSEIEEEEEQEQESEFEFGSLWL